jgi:hypothetical protein
VLLKAEVLRAAHPLDVVRSTGDLQVVCYNHAALPAAAAAAAARSA